MTWNDLETFTNVGSKIKSPDITITCKGALVFSSGFIHHAKKQMDKMSYITLSYSKNNKAIVIKFYNHNKVDGAIKISKKAKNYSCSIVSFLRYYGIKNDKTIKYIAKKENIEEKLCFWVIWLDRGMS